MCWENFIKDQGTFSLMIILLNLITISLDNVWILLGENWCWSPWGLKGLKIGKMPSLYRICQKLTKKCCSTKVVAYVASVSSRELSYSAKVGTGVKKGRGGGEKRNSPLPFIPFFFCSLPNVLDEFARNCLLCRLQKLLNFTDVCMLKGGGASWSPHQTNVWKILWLLE